MSIIVFSFINQENNDEGARKNTADYLSIAPNSEEDGENEMFPTTSLSSNCIQEVNS